MGGARVLSDERGSSIVEFAIVSGAFALLTTAALEFGVMCLVEGSLESAALTASRYGMTGADFGSAREERILNIIAQRSYGLVDTNRTEISTKVYPSFDAIGKAELYTDGNNNGVWDDGEYFQDVNGNGKWDVDMGTAGLGGPGDVVLYQITYPWAALTPLLVPVVGGATLSAAAAVRNEAW